MRERHLHERGLAAMEFGYEEKNAASPRRPDEPLLEERGFAATKYNGQEQKNTASP